MLVTAKLCLRLLQKQKSMQFIGSPSCQPTDCGLSIARNLSIQEDLLIYLDSTILRSPILDPPPASHGSRLYWGLSRSNSQKIFGRLSRHCRSCIFAQPNAPSITKGINLITALPRETHIVKFSFPAPQLLRGSSLQVYDESCTANEVRYG
ncbi:uncharacterized protein M421DRAFT_142364 [Didymella exigua CBS 183.55]|uniref:Uncharacterized protein n=1 Tax=Didymella exigua CBS 183.55 TaxID=1150837 RepID=A0A6A5RKF7_9PLEO|nr:uncharacterized protein M421DRAFT_142364 [Didymella exigua CBS 183.55]KAF1928901.1 hypothetical protein M421DRAFT_142364 [Didymella exigua CBS 183.55]